MGVNVRGEDIILRAQTRLLDEVAAFWTPEELLVTHAASYNALIAAKPNIYTSTIKHQLTEGVFQEIPEDGLMLVNVTRNIGEDGLTLGRAITQVDRDELDAALPGWAESDFEFEVEHYAYDIEQERVFYVYPGARLPTRSVELVYSPTVNYTDPLQPIPFNDAYADALFFYLVGESLMKDSERGDPVKANVYMKKLDLFLTGLVGGQAAFAADTRPGGRKT